ncbi:MULTISPECIES: hypothetical protein [unclassified Streptomyces]|uniref:hypothetical protein n=1 Tax=unclassified Streptomyces TaxID=2593676 RepID=UPI0033E4BD60
MAELRMLDRVARVLISGLKRLNAGASTPHLAVALTGGTLTVQGNSDHPVTAEARAARSSSWTRPQGQTPDNVLADDKRRLAKDARKLHAFTLDQYGTPLDAEWQVASARRWPRT